MNSANRPLEQSRERKLPSLFVLVGRKPNARKPMIGFILAFSEQYARKSGKFSVAEKTGELITIEACREVPYQTVALAADGKQYRVTVTVEEVV